MVGLQVVMLVDETSIVVEKMKKSPIDAAT
jgi:hypothetical protein